MSELLQFGPHPDADQLSAFVEQALPADERERTLAHLAVCPECRAVVALSLPPMDEPVRPLSGPARDGWVRWFSGWNLAWSTAALAATILFTVYVYRAATTRNVPAQTAHSQPSASTAVPGRPAEPAPLPPANPQEIGQLQSNAGASAPRSNAPAEKPQAIAALPLSGRNLSVLAAPSAVPGESRVPANNLMAAKKEAPAEMPAPPAAFGVARAEAPGGSASQPSLSTPRPSTENKVSVSAGIAPQAEAFILKNAAPPESVTVNADKVTVETASATAGEVITGAQVRELPLSGENLVSLTCVHSGAAPQKPQCPEIRLPSRLPAISTVAQQRLVLAIDANNAVFLSRDTGKRWKTVRAPWTGRAVKAALISLESGRGPESETATGGTMGALYSDKESLAGKVAGSLTGIVTDQTGAVIPGASVVVVNLATGAKRSVKTGSTGRYLVSGLAPGNYKIEASAPGFKMFVQTGVNVEVNREIAENLSLALGAVTEAVTVQADAVQVETTSPAVGEITPPPNTTAKPADKLRAKPAASAPTPPVFEITTDSGERWMSTDGLTWTRR
ncbi:MAG: carboxypeptidase regulatory-like domain-containing protein [Terracidiphilus sp.]|jgi:hypothetical protein